MVKMKRVWQFGAVSLASMVLLAGCSSKSNKEASNGEHRGSWSFREEWGLCGARR